MKKATYLITILFLALASSCEGTKSDSKQNRRDKREEILGRSFSDVEVLSIDIVEIEHPMLGGIISTKALNKVEQKKFLEDFDNLEEKGMYKCMSKYVIRLNFEKDTLRLKVCGELISNRNNDLYYELPGSESIIGQYIDEK